MAEELKEFAIYHHATRGRIPVRVLGPVKWSGRERICIQPVQLREVRGKVLNAGLVRHVLATSIRERMTFEELKAALA